MPDLTEEAGLLRLLRRPDDGALAVTEKVCKAINAGVAATGFSIEVLDQGHGEAPVALAQPGHQVDHLDGEERVQLAYRYVARSP
jgi:hypothetical protein